MPYASTTACSIEMPCLASCLACALPIFQKQFVVFGLGQVLLQHFAYSSKTSASSSSVIRLRITFIKRSSENF